METITLEDAMVYIESLLDEKEQVFQEAARNREIAVEIAKNVKDEWEAIEGYQKLLETLKANDADEETVAQVEEIISDELNHAEVLRKEMKKYDGGIETAED